MFHGLELQDVSIECLKEKYFNPGEKSIDDVFKRVALALANCEKPEKQKEWYDDFLWCLQNGGYGAGRIMANAGVTDLKTAVTLINCTVSQTIPDSIDGILDSVKRAAITLKSNAGIGYNFSTIRPKGAHVRGVGAQTGGPLPFMDIFDNTCGVIMADGGRRGAQMGCMLIHHPDIRDFIRAKREKGRLQNFNLSVLVTDKFMDCVKTGEPFNLIFPELPSDIGEYETVFERWPRHDGDGYSTHPECKQRVKCRIYEKINAAELWDEIIRLTYDFADPGVLFIDNINSQNPLGSIECIQATNPCGEQPLPPDAACLLGPINLVGCVENPFGHLSGDPDLSKRPSFDFPKLQKLVRIHTRMLDNVVDINGLPLKEQDEEIRKKRRHGQGITGFGTVLNLMGIKYGSSESVGLISHILRTLRDVGHEVNYDLGCEKGHAPVFDDDDVWIKWDESEFIKRIGGDSIVLGADGITPVRPRFTHHTSIAPVGTVSLTFGNNCSNGIEPTFAHEYVRNRTVQGKKSRQAVTVYSYEALLYRKMFPDHTAEQRDSVLQCTNDLTPGDHLKIMKAAQPFIDSAISKTINVPTEIPFEEFKDIYTEAHEAGLKGCTTFRFNPDAHTGVLVRKDDLENTEYGFELEDGTTVWAKGADKIEYEGEVHDANNLFDSIKDGRIVGGY